MKLSAIAATLLGAFLVSLAQSAYAQVKEIPPNSRVRVSYERIADAKSPMQEVRKRLESGKILDRLSQFLSPLRLPQTITLAAESCGQGQLRRRYKKGSGRVTICYEMVSNLEEIARKRFPDNQQWQRDTIVGAFTQMALHEVAHAVFDILKIPVWGRADDAADRLAALTMVMFGEQQARLAIFGTTDVLFGKQMVWKADEFASVESPELQRAYNFMCIAVASDPLTFEAQIKQKIIPEHRAERCMREFAQIRKAFNLRIMPHVDPDRLVLLRTRRWLP